jgi:hypothetical protein
VEANRPHLVLPEREDIGGCQSRVAAQVVLDYGSKPAQVEITISARNNKSGLAVPVLGRNFLHDASREKSGKNADARRVPCEELTREHINVVIRNCHVVLL